jgi:hypothetical protein
VWPAGGRGAKGWGGVGRGHRITTQQAGKGDEEQRVAGREAGQESEQGPKTGQVRRSPLHGACGRAGAAQERRALLRVAELVLVTSTTVFLAERVPESLGVRTGGGAFI